MNRTLLPQTSSLDFSPSDLSRWSQRRGLAQVEGEPIALSSYRLLGPVHYEPGYAYPLFVWLHGPESNEDELVQVMPLISVRNYVAVSPRGTKPLAGLPGACTWGESRDEIGQALESVEQCIALAQERFHIHPDRVFVAGHSTGGTLALRLAMECPERFAGAISLSGPVPRGAGLLRNFGHTRKLPMLLSVSPTHENYDLPQVMEDLRFLHMAGYGLNLQLHPAGDDLTTTMFSDVNTWIMEQVCPTSVSTAR